MIKYWTFGLVNWSWVFRIERWVFCYILLSKIDIIVKLLFVIRSGSNFYLLNWEGDVTKILNLTHSHKPFYLPGPDFLWEQFEEQRVAANTSVSVWESSPPLLGLTIKWSTFSLISLGVYLKPGNTGACWECRNLCRNQWMIQLCTVSKENNFSIFKNERWKLCLLSYPRELHQS